MCAVSGVMAARAVLGTSGCLLGDGQLGRGGRGRGRDGCEEQDAKAMAGAGQPGLWVLGRAPVCCGAQGRGGLPAQAHQHPVPPSVLKASPPGSLPDSAQSPRGPPGSRAAAP